MEAKLRTVSFRLVAAINDPIEESRVRVVLKKHLYGLSAKDLDLRGREKKREERGGRRKRESKRERKRERERE